MKQFLLALGTLLLLPLAAQAQVNIVNSVAFGQRPSAYAGDPYAGTPYIDTAADFSARVRTAGEDLIIFSPTGKCIATARGSMAWLWSTTDGANLAQMPQNGAINFMSFSHDGSCVVVVSGANGKIWNAPSGNFRAQFSDNGVIRSAVVSPDGRYIGTVTDSSCTVWSAPTGLMLFQLPGGVQSLLFSPDGKYLVLLAGGQAQLRRIGDASLVGNITHDAPIRAASFSADGRFLVVGTTSWPTFGMSTASEKSPICNMDQATNN